MNNSEYKKVEKYTYEEYCNYLQEKYGIGLCNYMTENWVKNKKVTRTSEGLYVHHKFEDHAIALSHKANAIENPYEWQMAENLVYCDLLEHLFLHILIVEKDTEEPSESRGLGSSGIFIFLVPELNDLYSGWVTKELWRKRCHEKIINDKDVYLKLLKRIKKIYKNFASKKYDGNKELVKEYNEDIVERLSRSLNSSHGVWDDINNKKLYRKIKKL